MAQKTVVILTDDLDGSEASETASFGIDGTSYEIDLSDDNAQDLRDALAPYVKAARRVTSGKGIRSAAAPKRTFDDVDPKAVRAWAQGAGVEVNQRGRIKADVVAQFRSAGH